MPTQTRLWAGLALAILVPVITGQTTQPENPVRVCGRGLPFWLRYGESTDGARIDTGSDTDLYWFMGTTGEQVRITLRSLANCLDPSLQVLDPLGMPLVLRPRARRWCRATAVHPPAAPAPSM